MHTPEQYPDNKIMMNEGKKSFPLLSYNFTTSEGRGKIRAPRADWYSPTPGKKLLSAPVYSMYTLEYFRCTLVWKNNIPIDNESRK